MNHRDNETHCNAIHVLCVLFSVALLAMAPSPARGSDTFAGKWKVVITPADDSAGNEKEFKDTIEFKGDQFTAEAFNKAHKFKATKYEGDTRRGPTATFTAEAKDQKDADGAAKWTGYTTGSEIQGELVWTKADGTEVRYTFKGSKS